METELWVAIGAILTALVALVTSFAARAKAKDAEAQVTEVRRSMGVLPPRRSTRDE